MFHKIIIFVFVLLCIISSAAATDYYVKTSGNNASDGLTIETAWRNVSYGVTQLTTPGDTLYLIDGTWYGEHVVFATSGNSANPITIDAYNGTPTLDGIDGVGIGIDLEDINYINVHNISVKSYYTGIDCVNNNNISLKYNTISNISGTSIDFSSTIDSIMSYNTVNGSVWNQIQIQGTTVASKNITISYNTLSNATGHNIIDFYHNFTDIKVVGNTIRDSIYSGIYSHQTVIDGYLNSGYVNISDNIIYNVAFGINFDDPVNNSIINNNTIYDLDNPEGRSGHHIKSSDPINNLTGSNNTMWGNAYGYMIQVNTINSLFSDNNITADGTDQEYRFLNYPNTIRDPTFNNTVTSWSVTSTTPYTIQYTDGTIFTGALYYPEWSNRTLSTGVAVTPIGITVKPTTGYGKDVVVNTNLVNDVSNITVNVSEPATVTMTFTVENATNTYNLAVNGIYDSSAVSNSDSIVEFDYIFSTSTPIYFEVTWGSGEGWYPTTNTYYQNRACTTWTNGTTTCIGATQEDTIIPYFNVVVS